jgi:hypothetical protein
VSQQVFYSETHQENLYHRLDSDYKEMVEGKLEALVNRDICYVAGGLISYGKLDLIQEFIRNHPLYNQDPGSLYKKSSRDIYAVLLDGVIGLFPCPTEILRDNKAVKIREFEYWILDNLLNLEWDKEKGEYLFKQNSIS